MPGDIYIYIYMYIYICISNFEQNTYTLHFVAFACIPVPTDFTSQALGQSCYCQSTREVSLKSTGKHIISIHNELLQNKTKQNKAQQTVCVLVGHIDGLVQYRSNSTALAME